jgi:hypothetical protein
MEAEIDIRIIAAYGPIGPAWYQKLAAAKIDLG